MAHLSTGVAAYVTSKGVCYGVVSNQNIALYITIPTDLLKVTMCAYLHLTSLDVDVLSCSSVSQLCLCICLLLRQ